MKTKVIILAGLFVSSCGLAMEELIVAVPTKEEKIERWEYHGKDNPESFYRPEQKKQFFDQKMKEYYGQVGGFCPLFRRFFWRKNRGWVFLQVDSNYCVVLRKKDKTSLAVSYRLYESSIESGKSLSLKFKMRGKILPITGLMTSKLRFPSFFVELLDTTSVKKLKGLVYAAVSIKNPQNKKLAIGEAIKSFWCPQMFRRAEKEVDSDKIYESFFLKPKKGRKGITRTAVAEKLLLCSDLGKNGPTIYEELILKKNPKPFYFDQDKKERLAFMSLTKEKSNLFSWLALYPMLDRLKTGK